MKPKIAIIIDKIGWAFSNAAEQIKKNLLNYYDIDIISTDIFEDNIIELFLLGEKYNLMFFMWRGVISWLYSTNSREQIARLGLKQEEFLNQYVKNKNIITGVYDHLFLKTETERTDFILDNVKDYVVCSEKLKQIYNEYHHPKKPSMVISDGVDLELFKMHNKCKYNNLDNKIIKIGWTGNSKFQDENDDDLKGLQKIIKPAIKDLEKEGYHIQLDIADRNIKFIPHNQMCDYYNNIDIYVCASRTEGHPEPILEAMACGVPIISTDVGIVPEIFGEKQKKFIIERSKEDLKKKIVELIKQKKKAKQLSKENLKRIQQWSWKDKAEQYRIFFEKNMKL